MATDSGADESELLPVSAEKDSGGEARPSLSKEKTETGSTDDGRNATIKTIPGAGRAAAPNDRTAGTDAMKLDDLVKEWRSNSPEPLWKLVLNWGAVIMFFTLPILILIVHLYAKTHPHWVTDQQKGEFQYIFEHLRNLTILVFGLAGLRTWEQIKNGKANNGPKKENS